MPYGLAVRDDTGTWRRHGWRSIVPGGRPSKAAIIAGAGLLTPFEELEPVAGSIRLQTPGMVYENKAVAGIIRVEAPDITIRNVFVTAFSTAPLVRLNPGGHWCTLEHSELVGQVNPDNPNDGQGSMISAPSGGVTGFRMHHTHVHGVGEPVKVIGGASEVERSVYDYNWLQASLPLADPTHLDGFQSLGQQFVTIEHNAVTAKKSDGADCCCILQGWSSPINVQSDDILVRRNYFEGGNFATSFSGGKPNPGPSDPRYSASDPLWYESYGTRYQVIENRYEGRIGVGEDTIHGYIDFGSRDLPGLGHVVSGNEYWDLATNRWEPLEL